MASSPAEPPRRVGLVGYGLAGRVFHAPLVRHTPGLALTAVVTADAGRAAAARHDVADVLVTPDVDRLLDGPDQVDLLVIAAANVAHVPLALAAVAARVAVVVDKPLAPTANEAERVVAAAAEAGVPLTVFQNRRWDGDFLTVQALVGEGRLGVVHRLESRFERWAPALRASSWREDPDPQQGAGLLLDLGAHLVDQARVLLGPVVTVSAELQRWRPGSRVDDDVLVSCGHAGGARSHLWASALSALPAPRFRVLGDRAGFTCHGLDPQEAQLKAGGHPGMPGWGLPPDGVQGTLGAGDDAGPVPLEPGDYGAFYHGVADALAGRGPMPVDPADAVATLRVLQAARQAAESGRVVALDPGTG